MIFAALTEAANKSELILVTDGMCRFHLRRDGVVVIREIIVLPFRRGTGVGRRMVDMVREKYPQRPLLAKCPREYDANGFWSRMGFVEAESNGRCREWWLR